jgi:hypothetical protein
MAIRGMTFESEISGRQERRHRDRVQRRLGRPKRHDALSSTTQGERAIARWAASDRAAAAAARNPASLAYASQVLSSAPVTSRRRLPFTG